MEEAEELCGEIAFLRQGELIAHQPTAELMRALHVTRPIILTLRHQTGEDASALLPPSFPAATAVQITAAAASSVTVKVESLDIRATTPALLAWVRERGFLLLTMQAEPVTLTDVFQALVAQRLSVPEGSK